MPKKTTEDKFDFILDNLKKSPEEAREALLQAGIITADGKLAPKYQQPTTAKKPKKKPPRICYMDKVDFDHELGVAGGGNKLFASVKDLEEHKPCTWECGIVEVEVRLRKVIRESDFSIIPNKEYMVSNYKDGVRTERKVLGSVLIAERKERQEKELKADATEENMNNMFSKKKVKKNKKKKKGKS